MSAAKVDAAQFELYRRYDGDFDALARSRDGSADAREDVWRLIDDFRQRMFIVESHKASDGFRARLEGDLKRCLTDHVVVERLRQLVTSDLAGSPGEADGQP